MIEVSATDFAKKMGQYRRAAHREPVAVSDRSGITEVLISKADFDHYQELKARETKAYFVWDLPDDIVEAIGKAEMDPRHAHLDALLDE
ncbi:hypothetical protein KOAAANKH_00883 [Brevundimonas sp. NIBR10]|uniref:type II toxin-antitoxin system Phd/YefM family antitoxin n=1 Tax=Brevundimonas sp. NIBR10 TaxID=3015997 RepID=UPI0022F1B0FD|nr:type II toxin-antitoxin system Phd/YefM family antitoxin [Brevundimonas sp. NIBR10]WGM46018.1 hypothetical protein KOAAANKH_00883 [Brevundimonas sp. NIBR10]